MLMRQFCHHRGIELEVGHIILMFLFVYLLLFFLFWFVLFFGGDVCLIVLLFFGIRGCLFVWFKHILFMAEHDKGLGRAKKLCFALSKTHTHAHIICLH